MGSINRGSLPQNYVDFLDSTNLNLRLPTPEPQYWFAKSAMGAQLSLAALDAGAPTVQQFVSMAGGGKVISPELDEMARAADAYPGTVTFVNAFGKGLGDTLKFDREVYEGGGYTELARELSTDATISTTGQQIKTEEIPIVLKEYHGPHDGTSVKPYAIWDFDAKIRANKEQLVGKVNRRMRRDYVKWLDTVIRDRFRATSNITYSDSVANVLSMTLGAGHIANLEMFMNARKTISDREWSKFSNGRYIALVPTKFNTDMIGDVDYREMSKVHADGRNLLYGYIGSIQDIDFFECTTLKAYAAAETVPGDGNAVPVSVTVQEALLLGPGAVGMGSVGGPEVRFADETNYGTVAKVIWYGLHAFQTLDSRAVQRILFQ